MKCGKSCGLGDQCRPLSAQHIHAGHFTAVASTNKANISTSDQYLLQ